MGGGGGGLLETISLIFQILFYSLNCMTFYAVSLSTASLRGKVIYGF